MTVKYANKLKQWCIHAMISDWVARYTQFMVPTTPPPPPINILPDLAFPRE